MKMLLKAVLAVGLLAFAFSEAHAFFEVTGVFIADEKCAAYVSIKRHTNPGAIRTVPGQTYNARGLNRQDGDYVQLEVPGAVPSTRWVNIACGDLFSAADDLDPSNPDDGGGTSRGFTPFFDNNDRPNDLSPRAPSLSAFDRAVLRVCGNWGSVPSKEAFRAMLDDPQHEAAAKRIHQALDGHISGPPRSISQFNEELAEAWFSEDGFRHIFCGEPSESTIGGLHFAGRYLEMQEKGWGGVDPRCGTTEIVPPVYTLGVTYRTRQGRTQRACPKGYGLNLDASEILIEGTKALKLMIPRSSGKAMCLHRVAEANERPYLAVFVIKNGAVRTFYPDASPSCDGNRPAENCLCTR